MSPKRRNPENRALPERWRYKHGAYYYRVPPGLEDLWDGKKEFRLGQTQPEAYREWAQRVELHKTAKTIGELLDRYAEQVVPQKAPKSQQSNYHSIAKLKLVFNDVLITQLQPVHVFRYMDKRSEQGKKNTTANRDLEVLSHAYTMAIKWGLCNDHPIKGKVQKLKTSPSKRYIEDWEVCEVLKVADPFMALYIKMKLMTGLRRGDLLSIKLTDLKEEGIYVEPSKTQHSTGKRFIIEWTDELRQTVEDIKALPSRYDSEYLFKTRTGQPFIKPDRSANSFDSRWQRFMLKALTETDLKERFREHDLRAKVASDTEAVHARLLLGHASQEITNRVYRRKPEQIKPAKYDLWGNVDDVNK